MSERSNIALHDLSLLIVDDNQYARSLAIANLKQIGFHNIDEADSGAEALLRLHSGDYDALIVDWYMPEISGAGLLSVVRDRRFGPAHKTPVIVMSAYTNRENVERALSLGADQVVAKPIKAAAMHKAISDVLQHGRQNHQSMSGLLNKVQEEDALDGQMLDDADDADTAFL
ncbi:two-component system chemotaxis response regulator CheY [Maritalea mobilis]|uniref:Two-component system chemotaxis response regulator CheY n=1 Tax=Maritalea mobilis TaxID=483324 RepID=A0A4R6VK36_9HYPH|nr:response regulator [Maritalea mobilis]TDQ64009.1 two-component system chemotaxis response regulator CheY [Maritalea mobilis]